MPDKRPLDPSQPVLYIEHCRHREIYRKRALHLHSTLADALRAIHPKINLQLRINDGVTPKVGAFEIAVSSFPTHDSGGRHMVWTGLKRMPSASKIPHVNDILIPVCYALKLRDPQKDSHRRVLTNLRKNEGREGKF